MTDIQKTRQHTITYGTREIDFLLELNHRKNLKINVHPDLSVTVKAPSDKSIPSIIEKVKKRASWIIKQKNFFLSLPPPVPERQYISGETHLYLGKQYRLKIIEQQEIETVKLKRGYINIYTKNKNDKENIKNLLNKWYLNHARKQFTHKLKQCYQKTKKYGIEKLPPIQIRKMKTRWGSCTKKGKILLNPNLIKTTTHCIEYVITHEICHIKHHNHNKQFYQLLSQVMPDWQQRKKDSNK